MLKLSVVLATYNEEKNIKECLESIQDIADEIILVDGSSKDNTVSIAKKYNSKVFIVSNKEMFHINKQIALEKATGDWILQLDADERLTSELKKEIQLTINNPRPRLGSAEDGQQLTINGYYIPRKNYFLGRFLTKGGQYPDYVIRLVRKNKAHFPCKSVHEQITVDGQVGYLKNNLLHIATPNLSYYMRNANRYTSLTAKDMMEQKIPLTIISYFSYLLWKPIYTFLNIYIRHKGFMDGFQGLVFALFSGLHYPMAYIKYWEKKNTNR